MRERVPAARGSATRRTPAHTISQPPSALPRGGAHALPSATRRQPKAGIPVASLRAKPHALARPAPRQMYVCFICRGQPAGRSPQPSLPPAACCRRPRPTARCACACEETSMSPRTSLRAMRTLSMFAASLAAVATSCDGTIAHAPPLIHPIRTGTGLNPSTYAPELDPPHTTSAPGWDRAHPRPHLRRDRVQHCSAKHCHAFGHSHRGSRVLAAKRKGWAGGREPHPKLDHRPEPSRSILGGGEQVSTCRQQA